LETSEKLSFWSFHSPEIISKSLTRLINKYLRQKRGKWSGVLKNVDNKYHDNPDFVELIRGFMRQL
jgi:hypothetical protein